MRFLSKEQKKKIGYEYILDNINTVTNVGAELKYNSKPFTIENKSALAKELENTEKFKETFFCVNLLVKFAYENIIIFVQNLHRLPLMSVAPVFDGFTRQRSRR